MEESSSFLLDVRQKYHRYTYVPKTKPSQKNPRSTTHTVQLNAVVVLFIPDHAEQVDVCIVHREINEGCSGPSVQPQVLLQACNLQSCHFSGPREVLVITSPAVCGNQAPVAAAIQILLIGVCPASSEVKESTLVFPLSTYN